MSKAAIYATPRSGGRLEKSVAANASQHFISTGSLAGSAQIVAEMMNLCLDRKWDFTVRHTENVFVIDRVI